jgi:hypothetical protein
MANGRPVVQTVPAARAGAAVYALVALLGFAFTIAFAHDRPAVVITSVPTAAFFSGGVILMMPRISKRIVPPPRRIGPNQLPPAVGIWKATVTGGVLVLIMGTAFVVWSLSTHEYYLIGVLLGGPIVTWDSVRRARRTEHEQHGILWSTTGFSWTSKSRPWYLVAKA